MNPLLEIFRIYILPSVSALGGITALIIYVFSRSKRAADEKKTVAEEKKIDAEAKLADAEAGKAIELTSARLQMIVAEVQAKVLESQDVLIKNLQGEILKYQKRQSEFEDDLSKRDQRRDREIIALKADIKQLRQKLLEREDSIDTMKLQLAHYETENNRLNQENLELKETLKKQRVQIDKQQGEIDQQQGRITELETQIEVIKRNYSGGVF